MLKMIFLFLRWDMLIPWRVSTSEKTNEISHRYTPLQNNQMAMEKIHQVHQERWGFSMAMLVYWKVPKMKV